MQTTAVRTDLRIKHQQLCALFHSAPIAGATGMKLHFDERGVAICSLAYNPLLDHGFGGIFGGMLSSMMDIAGWFAVAPHYPGVMVTVEYSTRILEETRQVDFWARGIARKLGRSTAFADMEVYTAGDRLVAIGSGTFRVTSRPIPPGS